MITVHSMQYDDMSHDALRCMISELDEFNKPIESQPALYMATKGNKTAISLYLWEYAEQHPDEVTECPCGLILNGTDPLPEGCMIVGEQIVSVASLENEAQAVITTVLEKLLSLESNARALLDPVFESERKSKIAALLAVREQVAYPTNIEWPDFVWECV